MNRSIKLKSRYYRWFPADKHLGYTEEIITINAAETAFVLVDVYLPDKQNMEAVDAEKKQLSEKEYELKYDIAVNCIAPALEMARKINLPIIYVTNSTPKIAMGNSEFAKKLVQAQGFTIEDEFRENTTDPLEYLKGAAEQIHFIDSLQPHPGDIYIRKHVYSGFYGTRLEVALRNMQLRNLIFAGFRIDACLGSTMLDALYRNFRVILLRDCTLACELPEELDEMKFTTRMLLWFETLIGATVDSKNFIVACKSVL